MSPDALQIHQTEVFYFLAQFITLDYAIPIKYKVLYSSIINTSETLA